MNNSATPSAPSPSARSSFTAGMRTTQLANMKPLAKKIVATDRAAALTTTG